MKEFNNIQDAKKFLYSLENRKNFYIKCCNSDKFIVQDKLNIQSIDDIISINEIKEISYEIETDGSDGIKAEVIYGDSVTPETSIMIRKDNKIKFVMIKNLGETEWVNYDNFKLFEKNISKEQSTSTSEVWDGEKWCKIKKIIRHKVNKKIYRVLTHTGYVEVTEDHSLIDENKRYIKPKNLEIGQKLYNGYPIEKNEKMTPPSFKNIIEYKPFSLEEKEAYIMGFFYADGSCGKYFCPSGMKRSWALNNQDRNLLNKCKIYLQEIYHIEFKILETMESSNVLKLIPIKNIKFMVDKYRQLCYEDKTKIVPDVILNNKNLHLSFISGYYAGDGSRNEKTILGKKLGCIRFCNKGQVGSSGLFYIMKCLNLEVSINCRKDKINIFRITSSKKIRKNKGEIKKIEEINKKIDYVYDIETESGVFQAGIGTMIVKNTDSIYTKFTLPGMEKMSKEETLHKVHEVANQCADRISETFRKPIELENEKTMWPLYLYGKKRYANLYYEKQKDGTFSCKKDFKGIQVVRRDNCKYVKTVCEPIFDKLLYDMDVKGAKNVAREYIKKLLENKIDIDELVLSKSLKSHYKEVNKAGNALSKPAHWFLAEKMRERDPGTAPKAGDRVPYIFIETKNDKCLQAEKVEDPEYAKENPKKCKPDVLYYLDKQLASPLYTIFEVLVKDKQDNVFPRKIKNDGSTEISKDCKAEIARLLWDKERKRKINQKQGNQEITKFFKVVSSEEESEDNLPAIVKPLKTKTKRKQKKD